MASSSSSPVRLTSSPLEASRSPSPPKTSLGKRRASFLDKSIELKQKSLLLSSAGLTSSLGLTLPSSVGISPPSPRILLRPEVAAYLARVRAIMWGQQGFWPPVDPAVSTLPAGHHQDPSYRPNYGSLPAQPHLWYPNYGQEQTPYPYKPYPSQAMDGGSTMHSGFSRSPPSITPNRPLAPTSNLKTFLTPPNNSERDSREELTPPDSDGDREDKPFQCGFPKCSYETNRRNNLKRHMATMHEKLNAPHVCCGFTFYRKADMRAHTKEVHVEGYPCKWPGCGKGFVRKALLDRHEKIHTGEKPFVCHVCQYGTSHKSNLDRHVRIHYKPPISPGKYWQSPYDFCPPLYMPRTETEIPNLPDSTTDPSGTPRRKMIFSPSKLSFPGMPFTPGPMDLANINPIQFSPEKAGGRVGMPDDLEAWWNSGSNNTSLSPGNNSGGNNTNTAGLSPELTPRNSSPNTSGESGNGPSMMTVPAAVKALPLTPPTPGKKQHQFHSIAAILSSSSLAKEEMMGKLDQDMEDEDNLNVDGSTSEEEGEEGFADYVEKKMRHAAKTEVQH